MTESERMIERLESAIQVVSYVIVRHNEPGWAPVLDRLEQELTYYKEERDPVSRARRHLQAGSSSVC